MNHRHFISVTVIPGVAIAAGLFAGTIVTDDIPIDTIDTESLWRVPLGVPDVIPEPEDNPFNRHAILLGRKLFFDPILSAGRDRACATCHQPEHGFASPDVRPAAIGGGLLDRNAPTLFNRAFGRSQMWDGRFDSLEEQALMPIEHELEMGLTLDEAIRRLRADPQYVAMFEQAYGTPPNQETLASALAAFVRRLLHGDTAVDHFREGRIHTMTNDERAGMWIFQSKALCWKCHNGFNFTDEQFHNTGVGAVDGIPRPGREQFTRKLDDTGAFKTPTLRALLETPPYFHDGSASTLRDVVEFYNEGGGTNAHLDEDIRPLNLTDREIDLLVTFLSALSRKVEQPAAPAGEDHR